MNFEEKEDMARYIVDLNEEYGMTLTDDVEHDMGVVMDISHRITGARFRPQDRRGAAGDVLNDPHVRRRYHGEEDEVLVDPDDKAPAAEVRA